MRGTLSELTTRRVRLVAVKRDAASRARETDLPSLGPNSVSFGELRAQASCSEPASGTVSTPSSPSSSLQSSLASSQSSSSGGFRRRSACLRSHKLHEQFIGPGRLVMTGGKHDDRVRNLAAPQHRPSTDPRSSLDIPSYSQIGVSNPAFQRCIQHTAKQGVQRVRLRVFLARKHKRNAAPR